MVKSLKYCLSLVIILGIASCDSPLTEEEKKAKADQIINGKTLLLSPHYQGSSKMMTLVEHAIALDPNNADARRELSIPYLKRGMPVQWKPLFDKAVALDPVNWQGWRGYLYLYFYRNYKKAIEDFDATDQLTPDFDDYPQGQSVNYMRGVAYMGLKDWDKAKLYFDTYINEQIATSGEDYADVTAFLYRGIIAYQNNEIESAIEDFLKVLQYSGNHYADAHYYLAKCFSAQNDFPKAKHHIDEAIKDFDLGYFHSRNYVEVLYQIYIQDLEGLKKQLENS
ncbi:tetratricopeptide repeat protein [Aquimarina spongiae]|uniref:Tetratricopeptide repeat-containing protein n=1 Tax=Aquimarina spongiae TaxID=570521 RepID=A0A1M6EIV8_9FLAO|nr:tetratricopeptide repeat protein [Aquimarina spongiae]SHI85437.1 Tetratricopeptide repeat-containing protein [Aquimarina spongiae]